MRRWYQLQAARASPEPRTLARMSKGSKSRSLGRRACRISEKIARRPVMRMRVRWIRRRREVSRIQ